MCLKSNKLEVLNKINKLQKDRNQIIYEIELLKNLTGIILDSSDKRIRLCPEEIKANIIKETLLKVLNQDLKSIDRQINKLIR